jgi:hypothetical protein
MGSRLRVHLTDEEDQALFELRAEKNKRVRERAEALRLSNRGLYNEHIADYLHWTRAKVRETIHRWNKLRLEGKGLRHCLDGLRDAPGRGRKKSGTKGKRERVGKLKKQPLRRERGREGINLSRKNKRRSLFSKFTSSESDSG